MQKMDQDVQPNNVDDFDNRPSKKAKYYESSVSDDPSSSPAISTVYLVSECFEPFGSESDNQKKS
jgi:hypothetical protein